MNYDLEETDTLLDIHIHGEEECHPTKVACIRKAH